MTITDLLSSALTGALLTLAGAIGIAVWQHHKDKETARHGLLAELLHIRRHYQYAESELPPLEHNREMGKRLKWSKFGDLHSVTEVGRYAILGAKEMQQLLQISLRIRNTDILIDMLLSDRSSMTNDDLEELGRRMKYVSDSAETLIKFLKQADPTLSDDLEHERLRSERPEM